MTERVTHRSIQEASLARIQGNLQVMGKLQDQISSGKKITRPSDDPSGTVSSLALRQQLRLNDQYQVQGGDGTSWLNTQDTALQTTSSQLSAARTLVVKALSEGSNTDGSRQAIAIELKGIAATVLSLANTQYQGRSVFAGTSGSTLAVTKTADEVLIGSGPPPGATTYTPAQYTWAQTGVAPGDLDSDGVLQPFGTSTPVTRQVDAQGGVRVDSNGAEVFGTDVTGNGVEKTQSLFSLMQQIASEVQSPKSTGVITGSDGVDRTCLPDLLTKLDTAISGVLGGLADVGARSNRIERSMEMASSARYDLTDQLSKVEDVDLPAVMIQMSLQETAYKAALQVTSKTLNTSLMDFLR